MHQASPSDNAPGSLSLCFTAMVNQIPGIKSHTPPINTTNHSLVAVTTAFGEVDVVATKRLSPFLKLRSIFHGDFGFTFLWAFPFSFQTYKGTN